MSRWHDDDHEAEEKTSRQPSPEDEITEELKRLMRKVKREEQAAELERRLKERGR